MVDLPGRMLRFFDNVAMDVPSTPDTGEALMLIGVIPLDGTFPLLVITNVTVPLAAVPLTSAAASVVPPVSDSTTNGAATVTVVDVAMAEGVPAESTVSTMM